MKYLFFFLITLVVACSAKQDNFIPMPFPFGVGVIEKISYSCVTITYKETTDPKHCEKLVYTIMYNNKKIEGIYKDSFNSSESSVGVDYAYYKNEIMPEIALDSLNVSMGIANIFDEIDSVHKSEIEKLIYGSDVFF